MDESPRSESVAVLADMSEALPSAADVEQPVGPGRVRQPAQAQPPQELVHPVAVTANVPVSLPVGSIIGVANSTNGTTFNVITTDQLQLQSGGPFKQMLCVDNGFICETRETDKNDTLRWNGELKTIVIQNSADDNESDPINVSSVTANSYSWTECANLAVLPIRCKNTNAELFKSRFGSGGRGRCIKLNNEWYTPSEFEALCGRASSKDWKRSIRFGGRSLQTLIDENVLRPHATSCTCSACCDDDNAGGPIRLFTPYKRRRRTRDQIDGDGSQKKSRRDSSRDGSNNEDSENEIISDKGWSSFGTSDEITIQHNQGLETAVSSVHTENGQSVSKFQKLEDVTNKLLKIAYEMKKVVEDLKAEEIKEQKRNQNIVTLDERTEIIETVGLQPAADSHNKKCANCNRDALAECSLCRRTPYCSTFCQRKDWNMHQVECVRDAEVMLIVESSGTAQALGTSQTREQ